MAVGNALPAAQVDYISVPRLVAVLKQARSAAKLTLEAVAEQAEVEPMLLAELESGNYQKVTLGTLRAYARATRMPWAASLAVAPAPPSLPPRAGAAARGRASQRRWEMIGAEQVWLDAGRTVADAPVRVRRKPRHIGRSEFRGIGGNG